MITIALGAGLGALVLASYLSRLWSELAPVVWPDEAPLAIHDDRARDQHLNHLHRLLAADDLHEAHTVVVGLVDRLLAHRAGGVLDAPATTERLLGPRVARFLAAPPLHSPAHYRRELDAALTRIEDL